jgi:acid stress-induced BolA-like protein IbaG/YrbA
LAALNLPKLKALAKGKITGASRLKKQQLILALMEAQITRKDLAAVRAA